MGTLDTTALPNNRIDWQRAHEALMRLARARAAADAEEGRWLLAAQRAAVHVHLGYGSFTEYIERLFGYRPRSTQEKLRVAQALEGLPAIAEALASGELSWCAVRELTRAAVSENEREWLDFARGKTVRQLEQTLACKQHGDAPDTPSNPAAQRHILRFEVAADTLALFRDALNELRRRPATPSTTTRRSSSSRAPSWADPKTKAERATKSRSASAPSAEPADNKQQEGS